MESMRIHSYVGNIEQYTFTDVIWFAPTIKLNKQTDVEHNTILKTQQQQQKIC